MLKFTLSWSMRVYIKCEGRGNGRRAFKWATNSFRHTLMCRKTFLEISSKPQNRFYLFSSFANMAFSIKFQLKTEN